MKKTLLTLFCAFTTLILGAQSAKTYTDNLIVTINGNSTEPQSADVMLIDKGDGTYDFSLKNFILWLDGIPMPVGNITLEGLTLDAGAAFWTFSFTQNIHIAPGDADFVLELEGESYPLAESDWAGPLIGEIPVSLNGKVNDERMYVSIDIDMVSTLGQIVSVTFGSDDFETGMDQVSSLSKANVIYDLQGRKLVRPISGQVYLQNGKKYIKS